MASVGIANAAETTGLLMAIGGGAILGIGISTIIRANADVDMFATAEVFLPVPTAPPLAYQT